MININNSNRIYLEWSGNYVQSDDYVELSATFAAKLGFLENQTVLINVIEKEISKANEIIIQPNSEYDWEYFKLYSNEIELNLLNQIKIVWSSLIVPVWPKSDICIYLKVHFKDTNQQLLRLETFTELIGVIDEREIKQLQQPNSNQSLANDQSNKITPNNNKAVTTTANESTLASLFKYLPQLPTIKLNSQQQQSQQQESTSESFVLPTLLEARSNTILNVIQVKQAAMLNLKVDLNRLNMVFVNSIQFQAKHKDRSIGKLVRLLSPNELNSRKELMSKKGGEKSKLDLKQENEYLETIVEINFIDQCPFNCLIACNSLILQLDLYPFSKVILNSINQASSSLKMNSQKVDDLTEQINNLNTSTSNNTQQQLNCLINIPVVNKLTFSIYQTIPNLDQLSTSICSFIKKYCVEHKFLILSKSTLIKFSQYEFAFQPEFNQNDYLIATEQSVSNNNLEIRILNQLKARLKTSWNAELPKSNLDQVLKKTTLASKLDESSIFKFKNYQLILDECEEMATECFKNDQQQQQNNFTISHLAKNKLILIYGKKGSGKSTLISNLINEFNCKQEACSLINLDCTRLKGKKIDVFKKSLISNLNESIYLQPCLLIIENLHILLPKNSNVEQEHKLDLIYNQKVKLILIDLIEKCLKETVFVYGYRLFTIVTSRSKDLFENQNLELDMFDKILELKSPSANCSVQLINHLIKYKLKDYEIKLDQINFKRLESILKTELTDCLPLDLDVIAERVINNSILNELHESSSKQQITFKENNYLDAFNNYIPFSLRSIKSKNKFKSKRLDDLGGLNEIKERLKQIILWPIKYPNLFKDYPIQPQTCILLYGMPGTGKTCLAQALANEFKINFISIKGPEILSKYIGASEQAIRDLFEKASLSKPCIIFFDEFDSIVPPRQNNNTDVTDRIVNQILTQMDGIECLQEGIYIIAATSRPDMIDPALLRPGRFDVCLECSLPTLEERKEILILLGKQLNLNKDVNLDEIAQQTSHFTGSDLNTLIINASNQAINQLISLDSELNVQNSAELEQNLANLKLNNSHFQLALQLTSPSFNENEIKDYNKM